MPPNRDVLAICAICGKSFVVYNAFIYGVRDMKFQQRLRFLLIRGQYGDRRINGNSAITISRYSSLC
jgi:hypothetical protein